MNKFGTATFVTATVLSLGVLAPTADAQVPQNFIDDLFTDLEIIVDKSGRVQSKKANSDRLGAIQAVNKFINFAKIFAGSTGIIDQKVEAPEFLGSFLGANVVILRGDPAQGTFTLGAGGAGGGTSSLPDDNTVLVIVIGNDGQAGPAGVTCEDNGKNGLPGQDVVVEIGGGVDKELDELDRLREEFLQTGRFELLKEIARLERLVTQIFEASGIYIGVGGDGGKGGKGQDQCPPGSQTPFVGGFGGNGDRGGSSVMRQSPRVISAKAPRGKVRNANYVGMAISGAGGKGGDGGDGDNNGGFGGNGLSMGRADCQLTGLRTVAFAVGGAPGGGGNGGSSFFQGPPDGGNSAGFGGAAGVFVRASDQQCIAAGHEAAAVAFRVPQASPQAAYDGGHGGKKAFLVPGDGGFGANGQRVIAVATPGGRRPPAPAAAPDALGLGGSGTHGGCGGDSATFVGGRAGNGGNGGSASVAGPTGTTNSTATAGDGGHAGIPGQLIAPGPPGKPGKGGIAVASPKGSGTKTDGLNGLPQRPTCP